MPQNGIFSPAGQLRGSGAGIPRTRYRLVQVGPASLAWRCPTQVVGPAGLAVLVNQSADRLHQGARVRVLRSCILHWPVEQHGLAKGELQLKIGMPDPFGTRQCCACCNLIWAFDHCTGSERGIIWFCLSIPFQSSVNIAHAARRGAISAGM